MDTPVSLTRLLETARLDPYSEDAARAAAVAAKVAGNDLRTLFGEEPPESAVREIFARLPQYLRLRDALDKGDCCNEYDRELRILCEELSKPEFRRLAPNHVRPQLARGCKR